MEKFEKRGISPKIFWTLGATILVAVLLPLHRGWSRPPAPAGTFSSGPGLPGSQFLPQVEREVGRLTNATRRQQGLPLLKLEPTLTAISRQHSLDMLRRRFFSHQNPEGLSLMDRLPPAYASRISRSGENIWTGSGHSPTDPRTLARLMLTAWMASPRHRGNILTPGFTYLGVGVAGSGGEVRATQIFVGIDAKSP
ncbi:MAG: CAP domain-containing protein [Thermodesulfobacteriota bacterium]